MTVTQKTRNAVYKRDDNRCILAGVQHPFESCSGILTVQHTVGKGMGGSKLFDTPDLLVTMCLGHNVLATADADFAAFCAARGLVRSRNSNRDPRLVPVLYPDGWYRLEGTGRVPINQFDAVEYMVLINAVMPQTFGYPHPVNADTSAHSYGESGRIGVFSLNENGPKPSVLSTRRGLTPGLEGLLKQSTFTHRQTALGGAE